MDMFEDCYSEGDGLEDLQRKEIELEKKFEEVLGAYDFQNLLGSKRHADSSLLEDLQDLTDLGSQTKRQNTMRAEEGKQEDDERDEE